MPGAGWRWAGKPPRIFTAEEAKIVMPDISIPADWQLQAVDIPEKPGYYGFQFISPEGKTVRSEDKIWVTPEGGWTTTPAPEVAPPAALAPLVAAVWPELPPGVEGPPVPSPEMVAQAELQKTFDIIYPELKGQSAVDWLRADETNFPKLQRDIETYNTKIAEEQATAQAALQEVYPGLDMADLNTWLEDEANAERFTTALKAAGRTPETELLLKGFAMTDEQVAEFFAPAPDITEVAQREFGQAISELAPLTPSPWGAEKWARVLLGGLGVAGAYFEQNVTRPWEVYILENRAIAQIKLGAQYGFNTEADQKALAALDEAKRKYSWAAYFSKEVADTWHTYREQLQGPAKVAVDTVEWVNPAYFIPIGGAVGFGARFTTRIPILGKAMLKIAGAVQAAESVAMYPVTKPAELGIRGVMKGAEKIGEGLAKKLINQSDNLLMDIPEFSKLIDAAFEDNWMKRVLNATVLKVPAVKRGVYLGLGPQWVTKRLSKEMEDLVLMRLIGRGEILRMGTNAANAKVMELRGILSNPVKEFGLDKKAYSLKMSARLRPEYSGAENVGTLEHIFIKPEMYNWAGMDAALDYVTTFHELNTQMLNLLKKYGVAPANVTEDWWIHRVVVGKFDKEGELNLLRGRPGMTGKALGKKPSYEMHRKAPTMEEGIAWGIAYARNPEVSIGTFIEEAYKKIADAEFEKSLSAAVVEVMLPSQYKNQYAEYSKLLTGADKQRFLMDNPEFAKALADVSGRTPKELLIARHPELIRTAELTADELKDARKLHDVVNRVMRGERPPKGTVAAIERRFPELGKELRSIVEEPIVSREDLNKYLKWTKAQLDDLTKALEKKETPLAKTQQELAAMKGELATVRNEAAKIRQEELAKLREVAYEAVPEETKLREAFKVMPYEDRLAYREVLNRRIEEAGQGAYEMGEELKGTQEFLTTDAVATYRGAVGKRQMSLMSVLKQGQWPETLTKNQAQLFLMGKQLSPNVVTAEGRVKWEYIIDELRAHFNMGEREFIDHIEYIAKTKQTADDLAILAADAERIEGTLRRTLKILDEIDVQPEFVPKVEVPPEAPKPAEAVAVTPEALQPLAQAGKNKLKLKGNITVKYVDRPLKEYGEWKQTAPGEYEILLNRGRSETATKDTLIHELTHIQRSQQGLPKQIGYHSSEFYANWDKNREVLGQVITPIEELVEKETWQMTAEAVPAAAPVKEPWQMTQAEFDALYESTRRAIDRQGAFLDVNALTPSQREVFLVSSGGKRDLQYASVKTRGMLVYRASVTEGKPVPAEVLKDYPDLAAKAPAPPTVTEGAQRILTPELNARGALLFHLTSASQAKSRESVLLAEFGESVLSTAYKEGLVTRSPKGIYMITLKGRDALRDINNLAARVPKGAPAVEAAARPAEAIPEAIPGMPEPGVQTDLFGYAKPFTPAGKGTVTQMSMEDYAKLAKLRADAGLPPPDVHVKPKIEGIEGMEAETSFLKVDFEVPPMLTDAGRKARLEALRKDVKLLVESKKLPYWQARAARAREMALIKQPALEQGYIRHPMFGGKLYDQEFIDAINTFFGHEKGSRVLSFSSDLAGILRITKAALDFSAMSIQGMPAWGLAHLYLVADPKVGAKMVGAWYRAFGYSTASFFDRDIFYAYMKKVQPTVMQRISFGGSSMAVDYMEAIQRGWTKAVLEKIPLNPFERANISFYAAGEYVRNSFWEILGPKALARGEGFKLARFLDNMTGVIDTKAMGIPATVRQLESSFAWFAPRYTRACLAVLSDIFRGGLTGELARKAIGGMVSAGAIYYTGIQFALQKAEGKTDEEAWDAVLEGFGLVQDPLTKAWAWSPGARFMTIKIGNYYFGIGSFWYGLMRLAGNIVATANEVGDREHIDFVQIMKNGTLNRDNPFIYWWFTRSSPLTGTITDLVSGTDWFMDRPFETPAQYAKYLLTRFEPIWMEQGLNPYIPGLAKDYEMPEGLAKPGLPIAELFGMRTFPESSWSQFYDKANTSLKSLLDNQDLLKEYYSAEELPKILDALRQGKLGWQQLPDMLRARLLAMYPDLLQAYETAQSDSFVQNSPEYKRMFGYKDGEGNHVDGLLEIERKNYYSILAEKAAALKTGAYDNGTKDYRQKVSDAGMSYGAILGSLNGQYEDFFSQLDEKVMERIGKYNLQDDIILQEYLNTILYANLDDKNGDYDYEERERRINAFTAKWGIEAYDRVQQYLKDKKNLKGLDPMAVRLWEDREALGRDFWKLPYKAIGDMEAADEKEVPAAYYALWKQLQGIQDVDAREAFIEANPDLSRDWRGEYRLAHPEDDARLAMWGYGGRLQTRAAYDLVRKWGQELGVPLEQMGLGLPPPKLIDPYFDYEKMRKDFSPLSAESKLFRLNNPEWDAWGQDEWGWKPIEDEREVLELKVKWRDVEAQYNAITDTTARATFLDAHPDYRDDQRRLDAYQKGLDQYVEQYVAYYNLPSAGYSQERFLIANPKFAEALGLKMPDRVPSEKYDILLAKKDRTPQDDLRMAAYKAYIPDNLVEAYANYYSLPAKGYDQSRFLQNNVTFYNKVWLGILGNQPVDFSKVPTAKFETTYDTIYLTLPVGDARYKFRGDNPWFEQEGVKLGKWQPYNPDRYQRLNKDEQFMKEWEKLAGAKAFQDWMKKFMK